MHLPTLPWVPRSRSVPCAASLVLALCILFTITEPIVAAVPTYFFTGFEVDGGWQPGKVTPGSAIRVLQGEAEIVQGNEAVSGNFLQLNPSDPFPAALIEGTPLGKAPHVYAELLVKPFAVGDNVDEEFLDFAGAILGFFRVGNHGELRALFERSSEESVWTSTGVRYPLDGAGAASTWLNISVHVNRNTSRWDLSVDGKEVLKGLRSTQDTKKEVSLYLYGHTAGTVLFDEILLTAVEPANLRKLVLSQIGKPVHQQSLKTVDVPKMVTSTKSEGTIRRQRAPMKNLSVQASSPLIRGWNVLLEIGPQRYESGPERELNGQKTRITVFTPRTDEHGNTLPGQVTIRADAELKPGTDLGKLRWMVAGTGDFMVPSGDVMAAGDFSAGLEQIVAIPAEWMRRAMLVYVWVTPSQNDALWSTKALPPRYPHRPESLPYSIRYDTNGARIAMEVASALIE